MSEPTPDNIISLADRSLRTEVFAWAVAQNEALQLGMSAEAINKVVHDEITPFSDSAEPDSIEDW